MSQLRSRLGVGALGLAMAGTLVGCVPAEQYAGMKMKADQLAGELAHAQADVGQAQAERDAAERQLQNFNNSDSARNALLTNLQQQNSDLAKENEDWNQKYANAMKMVGEAGREQALPAPLSNQLSEFAARNPELIDFDAARGVVKFKSDVTFPAGDATLTAAAKSVLTKFATILNSGGAEGYELLVAGHTDSTPVTNKRTIEKGNFNNWYLSAHRAISVATELTLDGVSGKRLGVVGYADERPVASNATEAGKAQNRRVEVLILPTSARSSGSLAVISTSRSHRSHVAAAAAAVPAAATLNKDSGTAAPAPAPMSTMNK
jgi:flagellar motor protein MotB